MKKEGQQGQKTEKRPAIANGSLKVVMDEVSNEIGKLMAKPPGEVEGLAFTVFFYTMVKSMLDITERMGLSSEEQEDILTACGTWFDIGMLAGRSPKLLLDILRKASPKIERFTPPEWFGEKDRAIDEVEKIIKQGSLEE